MKHKYFGTKNLFNMPVVDYRPKLKKIKNPPRKTLYFRKLNCLAPRLKNFLYFKKWNFLAPTLKNF